MSNNSEGPTTQHSYCCCNPSKVEATLAAAPPRRGGLPGAPPRPTAELPGGPESSWEKSTHHRRHRQYRKLRPHRPWRSEPLESFPERQTPLPNLRKLLDATPCLYRSVYNRNNFETSPHSFTSSHLVQNKNSLSCLFSDTCRHLRPHLLSLDILGKNWGGGGALIVPAYREWRRNSKYSRPW